LNEAAIAEKYPLTIKFRSIISSSPSNGFLITVGQGDIDSPYTHPRAFCAHHQ
jgi:hypothetical protein